MEILLSIPKNRMYAQRSAERSPLQDIAFLWWHKVSRQLCITEPAELLEVPAETLRALKYVKKALDSWRAVLNSLVQ